MQYLTEHGKSAVEDKDDNSKTKVEKCDIIASQSLLVVPVELGSNDGTYKVGESVNEAIGIVHLVIQSTLGVWVRAFS